MFIQIVHVHRLVERQHKNTLFTRATRKIHLATWIHFRNAQHLIPLKHLWFFNSHCTGQILAGQKTVHTVNLLKCIDIDNPQNNLKCVHHFLFVCLFADKTFFSVKNCIKVHLKSDGEKTKFMLERERLCSLVLMNTFIEWDSMV